MKEKTTLLVKNLLSRKTVCPLCIDWICLSKKGDSLEFSGDTRSNGDGTYKIIKYNPRKRWKVRRKEMIKKV